MKLPSKVSQNNQSAHSIPLSIATRPTTTTTSQTILPYLSTTNSSSCYEPTSAPVADASESVSAFSGDHVPEWNEHGPPISLAMEDLESVMMDLAEEDNSSPEHQTLFPFGGPHQNPNLSRFFTPSEPLDSPPTVLPGPDHDSLLYLNQYSNYSQRAVNLPNELFRGNQSDFQFDCLQLDQLFRAAECFDLNELELARLLLANQRLRSPVGKPLQRAAFYFKEALQSLLNGSWSNQTAPLSTIEIFHKIQAYKDFHDVSPIIMFSNFTANQALVEAVDGAMLVHVIDFDIGLGGHWASFMKTIAERSKVWGSPPLTLRVTAVISEISAFEAKLIRDHLTLFAQELNVRFHIEFLQLRAFALLWLEAISFMEGEKICVHLSPAIFRHLGVADSARFFDFLQRISPKIIVLVDREGWRDAGATTFRQSFIKGMDFYSTLLESLDASNSINSHLISRIEMFLLRPSIFAAVRTGRNHMTPWRELFSRRRMVAVPFSHVSHSQAECLLNQTPFMGFHPTKREAEMLLCWQEKELVATSAWRCS